MTNSKLAKDVRQRDPKFANTPQATTDCDCGDCACPVDGFDTATLDMPLFYSLELTPYCNSHCPGCSNVFVKDKPGRLMSSLVRAPMPFAKWCEILDTIAPHVKRLKITGGEPTLHPDFEQIIDEIERRRFTFTLFTNARWESPQRMVDFLRTKNSCVGLLISLHGATSQAHESFTGVKGSFEEILPNIQLAAGAGISVHTSCVFTQRNMGQIEAIMALSEQLGAGATVFNRYIGSPIDGISVAPHQLIQAIQQVDELHYAGKSVRFGTCIPLCFVESTSTGCMAGTAYCTIDPWGNMRPCNHTPWITGNILTDSLSSAWHSDLMNYWRSLIPDDCITCSLFRRCRGGCRAEAVLNEIKQDPLIQRPSTTLEEAFTVDLKIPVSSMRMIESSMSNSLNKDN